MSDAAAFEFMMRRRVEPIGDGSYKLDLAEEERALLRTLPNQLRDLLETDDRSDPAVQRLFPAAYRDDEEREAEYQQLMRGDLRDRRLAALALVEESIDLKVVNEEQLVAWMGAINDLRLVLGTRLDVTEDLYEDGLPADDPRQSAFELFMYLGVLMEQFVEALSGDFG
jgi:hypothetical protein